MSCKLSVKKAQKSPPEYNADNQHKYYSIIAVVAKDTTIAVGIDSIYCTFIKTNTLAGLMVRTPTTGKKKFIKPHYSLVITDYLKSHKYKPSEIDSTTETFKTRVITENHIDLHV